MGIAFVLSPVDIEEDMQRPMPAKELASLIAQEKLEEFLRRQESAIPWALAADSFIDKNGTLVGKALTREEARANLEMFSGQSHQVITGLALYCGAEQRIYVESEVTTVRFRSLTYKEIDWYLDTEEWQGVAGSYRIQARGECLVERIEGSYSNVVGLPITCLYKMLHRLNYPFSS